MIDDLFHSAKRDDIETLSRLIIYPFNANTVISILYFFNIFSRDLKPETVNTMDWQLQSDPPLLSVVCFYASIKCFNLLLAMGAKIHAKDKNGFIRNI